MSLKNFEIYAEQIRDFELDIASDIQKCIEQKEDLKKHLTSVFTRLAKNYTS